MNSKITDHPDQCRGGGEGGVLGKAIDLITSIFTPFLWILAGTGLLKALLAVAIKITPTFAGTSTYAILYTAGDAIFPVPAGPARGHGRQAVHSRPVYTSLAIVGALIYSATVAVIPDARG